MFNHDKIDKLMWKTEKYLNRRIVSSLRQYAVYIIFVMHLVFTNYRSCF